jgi:hypothetical protein
VNITELIHALAPLEACTTSDEVAALLEREGITGARGSNLDCPIARYLNVKLGKAVFVGPFSCSLRGAVDYAPTPVVVARFIGQFDAGLYPQLIDTAGSPA